MLKSFILRLFRYRFHVLPFINLFIYLQIGALKDYKGVVDGEKRKCPIIVSLTSYGERFSDLPITLYSLLNQSLKPDRVILWLDSYYQDLSYLPYEVTQFIKNGLEIRFVKDIGPYTKSMYSFKEFKDSIIVTADDDIYYPKNWLKNLYLSYISNPEDIHVHRSHKVFLTNDFKISPYENWQKHVKEEKASYDNFLTGVGGVLYPPMCFSNEVTREDIFLKCAPIADDIWLWVMALVHNRKIRVVKSHIKTLIVTNLFRQLFKRTLYRKNRKGENDKQLKCLLTRD